VRYGDAASTFQFEVTSPEYALTRVSSGVVPISGANDTFLVYLTTDEEAIFALTRDGAAVDCTVTTTILASGTTKVAVAARGVGVYKVNRVSTTADVDTVATWCGARFEVAALAIVGAADRVLFTPYLTIEILAARAKRSRLELCLVVTRDGVAYGNLTALEFCGVTQRVDNIGVYFDPDEVRWDENGGPATLGTYAYELFWFDRARMQREATAVAGEVTVIESYGIQWDERSGVPCYQGDPYPYPSNPRGRQELTGESPSARDVVFFNPQMRGGDTIVFSADSGYGGYGGYAATFVKGKEPVVEKWGEDFIEVAYDDDITFTIKCTVPEGSMAHSIAFKLLDPINNGSRFKGGFGYVHAAPCTDAIAQMGRLCNWRRIGLVWTSVGGVAAISAIVADLLVNGMWARDGTIARSDGVTQIYDLQIRGAEFFYVPRDRVCDSVTVVASRHTGLPVSVSVRMLDSEGTLRETKTFSKTQSQSQTQSPSNLIKTLSIEHEHVIYDDLMGWLRGMQDDARVRDEPRHAHN
jgi:hypothetical protein